jgi:hypothetical protein
MKGTVRFLILVVFFLIGYIIYLSNKEGNPRIKPTPTQSSTMVATSTSTQTPSPTFTLPPTFDAAVVSTTFCYIGPTNSFVGQTPVSEGMYVEILATIDNGGWFMIRSIGANLDPCWIVENALVILDTNFDLAKVQVFTTLIMDENTECRIYPDIGRSIQTVIPADRRLVAYGRSDHTARWILVVPHDSTNFCWVENKFNDNYESLPIEAPDFALALTSTPTNTPTTTGWPPTYPIPTRTSGSGNHNTPRPRPTIILISPPTFTLVPPSSTPVPPPTNTRQPTPTPTLCWPPGQCKTPKK